jgi:hypothetical protein
MEPSGRSERMVKRRSSAVPAMVSTRQRNLVLDRPPKAVVDGVLDGGRQRTRRTAGHQTGGKHQILGREQHRRTTDHQTDDCRQTTDLAVGGSSPSRRATKTAAQRPCDGVAVVLVGPGGPLVATILRPRQQPPRTGLRPVGCQKSVSCHAAWSYSWIRPPRTSRRRSCPAISGSCGARKPWFIMLRPCDTRG